MERRRLSLPAADISFPHRTHSQVTATSAASPSNSLVPAMELPVLQANLTRIVSENSTMKETLVAKSQKIEELNRRIGEILAENQSFVEQSHKQLIARNSRCEPE